MNNRSNGTRGRESSADLPPLPAGANINKKGPSGSWLRDLPSGAPKGLGKPLGTSGTQARRRCTGPPCGATVSSSQCFSQVVPGAPDISTRPFLLPHSRLCTFMEGYQSQTVSEVRIPPSRGLMVCSSVWAGLDGDLGSELEGWICVAFNCCPWALHAQGPPQGKDIGFGGPAEPP